MDKLVFDKIIYSGLVGTTLSASQFLATVGQPTATTASQRFLYNLSTGDLFFDPDGSGATTATQVANLNRFNPAFPSDTTSANALVPTLLAGDFILV